MSKNFIEKISSEHLKSSQITLESLQGAINRIKKTFPRYASFLMEFIQNSDDAKATSLYIELKKNNLLFNNNGLEFTDGDVRALCMVGSSEKNVEEGYIGYLGVGFKSIFIISDSAEVHSGKFHFKFDKNNWEDTGVPWEIIPIWTDENKTPVKISSETYFKLKIKNKRGREDIRRELNTSNLNNRILLFMQNVTDITINDVDNNHNREIHKHLEESNKFYSKYNIKETVNGELETETSWLVFSSICNVPKEVQNDDVTLEWERQNVKTREVAIAFRLNENNDILVEKQGTAHIGVFSFLPLKEIPSGLNYSIQGDYITTAGRADLARDNKWNEWISTQIYQLIKENCIPYFLKHNQWKWNITKIFYSAEGGHEIFENFIKKPLHTFLETGDVLIDIDEEKCNSKDAIYLGKELLDIFTNQELKILYPNDKILHHKCQVHPKILKQPSPPLYEFIKQTRFYDLAKKYAGLHDKEWFTKLYRILVEKFDRYYFKLILKESKYNVKRDHCWAQIAKSPIILTNRFALVSANQCYTNPYKIKIPKVLSKKIKVVHPDLLENQDFIHFMKELTENLHYSQGDGWRRSSYDKLDSENNLVELNKQIINYELENYYLKSMNPSKWKKMDEDEKIEFTCNILANYIEEEFNLDKFDYITLKTKSGKWLKPKKILYSELYQSDHNLEKLYDNKLLDGDYEFLSDAYLNNYIEDNKHFTYSEEISSFFTGLGVDTLLLKHEKITERIGILCALEFEKKENRDAIEIGQSKSKTGDIQSGDDNNSEIIIEVKARKEKNPDIDLTINQSNKISQNKIHFLYIVSNAMMKPELTILSSTKILELAASKIHLKNSKWNNKSHIHGKMTFKV